MLLDLLTRVIDEDRYPLTPRIQIAARTSPLPPGSTWRSPRVSSRRRRLSRLRWWWFGRVKLVADAAERLMGCSPRPRRASIDRVRWSGSRRRRWRSANVGGSRCQGRASAVGPVKRPSPGRLAATRMRRVFRFNQMIHSPRLRVQADRGVEWVDGESCVSSGALGDAARYRRL